MAKRAVGKGISKMSDGEEWFYIFFDSGSGESIEEMARNAINFMGAEDFEDAVIETVNNQDMADNYGYEIGSEADAIIDSILDFARSKGINKSKKQVNKMPKKRAIKKNSTFSVEVKETGDVLGDFDSIFDAVDYVKELCDEYNEQPLDYEIRESNGARYTGDGWLIDLDWSIEEDEGDADKSAKKQVNKMAKSMNSVKKRGNDTGWIRKADEIADLIRDVDDLYSEYWDNAPDNYWTEQESNAYARIDDAIDELVSSLNQYIDILMHPSYSASTKKSRMAKLSKRLNKLGGFTKEDDEEKIEIDDDDVVEIESEETHEEEVADGEESESDNLNAGCKGCKSNKAMRTSKKRIKMRKEGINLPEDADEQQDINQKGSGNAGSELPEDADEVTEINEKGSGNAGSELPEDADDAEDQKQASKKSMRKFSVTNGGSPDQTSYIDRYNQSPLVRRAIDNHVGGKSANKSFDEVQMLQDRIDAMGKSRRNSESNNVPMKLRRR